MMQQFKNQKQLDSYPVARFENGEMVFLTEEKEYKIYDNGEWKDLPKATLEGDGVSMSLYDLNKSIISQLPKLEDLTIKVALINDFDKFIESEYYMLLCRDISYYTIFNHFINSDNEFSNLGEAVLTCAQELGDLISVELTADKGAIEIWVKTDEDCLCMYLFNCANLIVNWGN